MKTGIYKGKTYRVEFIGATKFGHKAKLSFMDGSKAFWVDSALVSGITEVSDSSITTKKKTSRNVCAECGKPGALFPDPEDGMYKHYNCCDIPPGGY